MEEAPTYLNALPLKTMLLEYRLESVLGMGGFGITYLGWDTNLEKHVAIKEYLPGQLAMRALDGSVVPVNTDHKYNFKWGLERFIQEARTLARFSHPNIVRVNRFFEANGTSYMVMDYEAGQSLSQRLRRAPISDELTLKNILLPILDGLQAVHEAGFLHRDIKPSNVFVRENGTPLLLDFGAARMAADGDSKSLTAIVSAGYAPLEQYSSGGNQGPWSDIYALAGVMYRAVTNEIPPDAVKRMKVDNTLQALAAARTRFSERFLKAIEYGMLPDEKLRPQSIAEWREMFLGNAPLAAPSRGPSAATPGGAPTAPALEPAVRTPRPNAPRRPAPAPRQGSGGAGKWLLAAVVLIVLALGIAWTKRQQPQPPAPPKPLPAAAQPGPRAEPPPEPPAEPRPEPRPEPFQQQILPQAEMPLSVKKEFDGADADANGYLTPDEVKGRFPFIERNFALVDTDRDGRISAEEFLQLRRKQQAVKRRQ
jgi:serine/threonine protein kinase